MLQSYIESWGIHQIEKYLHKAPPIFVALSSAKLTKLAISASFIIGFVITLVTALLDVLVVKDQTFTSIEPTTLLALAVANIIMIALEFWLLFQVGFLITARYIREAEKECRLEMDIRKSLVRAVMELDEPAPKKNYGLNPYRSRSKHYWLVVILYKVKVMFSNVIAKVILRKIIGRGSARVYVPLIATIITGFWDAWVQASVLKEAKLRIDTRLYTLCIIDNLKSTKPSQQFIEALTRAVAVRLELFGSYNINLNFLLNQIELLYPGAVTNTNSLYDQSLLLKTYERLSNREKEKISHILGSLMRFKRGLFSGEEKQLMKAVSGHSSHHLIKNVCTQN